MGFLRKAIDFVVHPTHSRTLGLVVMLVLAAAVSLTVYVAQQQQDLRQRAASPSSCNPACEPNDPCIFYDYFGTTGYSCSSKLAPPTLKPTATPTPSPIPTPTAVPTPAKIAAALLPTPTPTKSPICGVLGQTCCPTNPQCLSGGVCGSENSCEQSQCGSPGQKCCETNPQCSTGSCSADNTCDVATAVPTPTRTPTPTPFKLASSSLCNNPTCADDEVCTQVIEGQIAVYQCFAKTFVPSSTPNPTPIPPTPTKTPIPTATVPPTNTPTPQTPICSIETVKGNLSCFVQLYNAWKADIKIPGKTNILYFNNLKNKYLGK